VLLNYFANLVNLFIYFSSICATDFYVLYIIDVKLNLRSALIQDLKICPWSNYKGAGAYGTKKDEGESKIKVLRPDL